MALFLVNKSTHDGVLSENLLSSHSSYPLLATGWHTPTSVLVTDNEGDTLAVIREPAAGSGGQDLKVTSLAWHPVERLLVIGWSNGTLTLWSMAAMHTLGIDDNQAMFAKGALNDLSAKAAISTDIEESVREHNSGAVNLTYWTTQGQYLLSTSQQKTVTLWALDRTATTEKDGSTTISYKLNSLWSVESAIPITKAIHVPSSLPSMKMKNALDSVAREEMGSTSFTNAQPAAPPPPKPSASAGKDSSSKEDDIAFLLQDGSGSVFSLTEEQKIATCITHPDPIAAYLYEPKDRTLVTLTSKYMMDIYRVGEDLSPASTLRRKLSAPSAQTTTEKFSLCMEWAGEGLIAFGCGDDKVRMFDVASESMYMLTLPTGDGAPQHITTLSAQVPRRMVTVCTAEGSVVVYLHKMQQKEKKSKRAVAMSAADACKEWEPLAAHAIGARIDRVISSPLGDLAVCTDGKSLQVLHEMERNRAWDGVAAATQISTDLVVIESVTGCQCMLKSRSKVRALSISFPNIGVWNGSQIDIYMINESNSTFMLVNCVTTTSPAFAMHPEGILYVSGNRITFATLQLQTIAQMTFTEAEGFPIVLDVMNDFMVAVSSKNILRIARISARDLRALGPSRPFTLCEEGPQPNVVCARINAQGRRVALMTTVSSLRTPDTRIWVYDTDTDKVAAFDFATRREIPNAVYWNTPEPNAGSIGELEYQLLVCETHQAQDVMQKADAEPTNDATGGKSGRPAVLQDDLPEAMPDMENFADKKAAEAAGGTPGGGNVLADRAHTLVSLFSTREGLAVHNSVSLKPYQICLVGLTIPDFLLASVKINGNPSNAADYVIEQKRLRDFDGLKSDKEVGVREALMKFSYYSTIGNMDEAYRCLKGIKDVSAWQGLAKMCVSNGRLDVAAVCLATMQDGVVARALRESREDYPDDKNVQLATLACGLGLMEECEQLLRASKRYDLITDVFLACGKFEQAQRHSEKFDRIRIRPVAYKYAQFMESLQNMDVACMWYYNARCAGTDVPRIYHQAGRLSELRELVMPTPKKAASPTKDDKKSAASPKVEEAAPEPAEDPRVTFATLFPTNKELLQWWAKYSERRRETQDALSFLNACKDTYSTVRILCSMNPPKIEKALEIVNAEVEKARTKFNQLLGMTAHNPSAAPAEPEPVGAAYFIGQHYEKAGDLDSAIEYYKHARAFHSSVRLARRAERDGDCLYAALSSGDERLMLDTALYFEERQVYDKAVELYRKIGAVQCALDGCIAGGLFETLQEISASLASASTDPQVFLGMADHFQKQNDYQKAVEMLVFAKRYDEALQMCQDRNVVLSEDMAETMTGENNVLPADEKMVLLRRVAQIAKEQGSWNLACKKYTQAGERLKAMKMLMRGGDVGKVIFFANHSRNAEIFTLAANFLQNQNWSSDPNVYKSIILFYTKAKAYDSLIAFFDSCAQYQIDENRDYRAALATVEECVRTMEKAVSTKATIPPAKITEFKERADILQAFVRAQQLVNAMGDVVEPSEKQKGDEVVNICSDFIKRSRLNTPDREKVEAALRIGDVFALLVRFYFEKLKEPRNALKVLESMPKHGIQAQLFIEMDMLEKVCAANSKRVTDITQGPVVMPAAAAPEE